jgi:hypothetical protein
MYAAIKINTNKLSREVVWSKTKEENYLGLGDYFNFCVSVSSTALRFSMVEF